MNKSTKFSPEVRERAVRMVQVLMPDGVINGDSRSFVALLCWGRVLLIFVTLSSCPLALSPEKDDLEIAKDPGRVNNFKYATEDEHGYLTPLSSHIRRVNPRDSLDNTVTNVRLHKVFRKGTAYGPALPEGVLEDDGADRGL